MFEVAMLEIFMNIIKNDFKNSTIIVLSQHFSLTEPLIYDII